MRVAVPYSIGQRVYNRPARTKIVSQEVDSVMHSDNNNARRSISIK
jgi:hypothetical protein